MKQDYVKGFARKCASFGVDASKLVKEAGKAGVLSDFIDAISNAYSGSGLQGVLGDIGDGAGEAWNSVADSDVVGAIGDAGSATGTKIADLAVMIKEMLSGGAK